MFTRSGYRVNSPLPLEAYGHLPQVELVRVSPSTLVEEIDATGRIEPLFPDAHVTQFFFDPGSGLLIGAATMEAPGAQIFDAAMQKHDNSTRRAFAGRAVHLHSFSPNLREMIVFTEGKGDSGTYWLVSHAQSNRGLSREIQSSAMSTTVQSVSRPVPRRCERE